MVCEVIGQEMRKLLKIRLFFLLKIIHHILAQECTDKPTAPGKSANARVKCLESGGCKLSCKARYLFPTGESSVYYECVEGKYKLKTDIPGQYKECKPTCKPPCGNGGNCIRPNTCDCQQGWAGRGCKKAVCKPPCINGGKCVRPNSCDCQVGWTGNGCQEKVTPKPVITTTPIYTENLVTTEQSPTTLLQDTTFVIPDSMDMSTETNAAHAEQTMQSSTELIETTINIDGDFSMTSIITDFVDMVSTTTQSPTTLLQSTILINSISSELFNVTEVLEETTHTDATYLCTDTTETTYNVNENQDTTFIIPDSMDMSTAINGVHEEQTIQSSTESLETTINTDGNFSMTSFITDYVDMVSSTNDDDDVSTTKSPFTEISETMKNINGGLTVSPAFTTPQSPTESSETMVSTEINVVHVEHTMQSSTELLETTINIDSDSSITSIITDYVDMVSSTNDNDISTTKSPFTEISETMKNINGGLTVSPALTDILEMNATTDAADMLTTPQSHTESFETMIYINGGHTISSEITDIIEINSITDTVDTLTTSQSSNESSDTITDIIGMNSSMYDAEKEPTTQILIEFIKTQMDNEDEPIEYTVSEESTEIPQSTVSDILPVTESTNYPKLNELSTLPGDSTKVFQEKMSKSTDYFSIEEETEITYNVTRSSILSTNKLNNFSTEGITIFYMMFGNHSNNNSEIFSTQSTNIENSTSELFLTTNLLYDTSFNITTHKNIISYILNNVGFGLQEYDCGEPLWWLVLLLLAITVLLISTNIIICILSLKWRNKVLAMQKRIGNHRKQSMPITFFRTLEFNAEMEYPVALSDEI